MWRHIQLVLWRSVLCWFTTTSFTSSAVKFSLNWTHTAFAWAPVFLNDENTPVLHHKFYKTQVHNFGMTNCTNITIFSKCPTDAGDANMAAVTWSVRRRWESVVLAAGLGDARRREGRVQPTGHIQQQSKQDKVPGQKFWSCNCEYRNLY